ncbi:DivIVA domain-containing protein [Jiangella muralis]|uniref:DivIVA domain-containing protein n=1 Tax=Jiangella muralis TaxID=702383 RepID=UPI00069D30FB|nr:DivIVA domain-containing protein [Jiangella muralis]
MAAPRFTVAMRGYDRAQVDAYCALVEAALAGGEAVPAHPGFTVVLRGYDPQEVDAWIRERTTPPGATPRRPAVLQVTDRPAGERFTVVRLAEGYDIGEVDAFLDRVRGTLGATLTADEVRQVQFTTVRLRAGYDMRAVDEYLDEVAAEAGRAAPAVGTPAAEPTTADWHESLADRYELLKVADRPAGDRFRTVRLREGYDLGEVDAFVDHVRATLATTLTAAEVRGTEFTTVRLREGYDMQTVDEWLDAVQAATRG